jgi:hypothetical protein
MIYKTLHRKLTIKHHEPHKKRVELRCSFTEKEEFEDTKGVIRICKSKDRQYNGKKKTQKQ